MSNYKKILVTGSYGQLGSELKVISDKYKQYQFYFTDIPELDITNASDVNAYIERISPDYLVNCAAYTAVDKAESEVNNAMIVNRDAVRNLVNACTVNKVTLIHISTDYVFDGCGHFPYTEEYMTAPVSVYGKSKLEGEKIILSKGKKVVMIRVSWLYSYYGNNFVKSMLKYGREKEEINVVVDQIGSPTYAYDLAEAVLRILPQCDTINSPEIFHYSNTGVASWFDFAKAIFEMSGIKCRVNPILTKDWHAAAQRPHYSVMNTVKFRETFGMSIPYWKDSLKHCLLRLNK